MAVDPSQTDYALALLAFLSSYDWSAVLVLYTDGFAGIEAAIDQNKPASFTVVSVSLDSASTGTVQEATQAALLMNPMMRIVAVFANDTETEVRFRRQSSLASIDLCCVRTLSPPPRAGF